jgi:hypothetical protein
VAFLGALALGLGTATAAADDEAIEEIPAAQIVQQPPSGPATWFAEEYPHLERAVNLPFALVARKFSLLLVVDHRTMQPIQENTWHDYFGLDGTLKVGLGLRFGLWDHLDLGFYRLNDAGVRFDTYQWDVKYQLLQAPRHFVDVALSAGLSWFVQEDAEDAVGFFSQLLVSRRFWQRVTLGTGLLFHSNSTNGAKTAEDDNPSLATMLAAEWRLTSWLAWSTDLSISLAGFGPSYRRLLSSEPAPSSYPSFSTAAKFITHRHTFALVLTNNSFISADGYLTNSPRGFKQLGIGFTITREWNL